MEGRADELLLILIEAGYKTHIRLVGRGKGQRMICEVFPSTKEGEVPFPLVSVGDSLEDTLESILRQINAFKDRQKTS